MPVGPRVPRGGITSFLFLSTSGRIRNAEHYQRKEVERTRVVGGSTDGEIRLGHLILLH